MIKKLNGFNILNCVLKEPQKCSVKLASPIGWQNENSNINNNPNPTNSIHSIELKGGKNGR